MGQEEESSQAGGTVPSLKLGDPVLGALRLV